MTFKVPPSSSIPYVAAAALLMVFVVHHLSMIAAAMGGQPRDTHLALLFIMPNMITTAVWHAGMADGYPSPLSYLLPPQLSLSLPPLYPPNLSLSLPLLIYARRLHVLLPPLSLSLSLTPFSLTLSHTSLYAPHTEKGGTFSLPLTNKFSFTLSSLCLSITSLPTPSHMSLRDKEEGQSERDEKWLPRGTTIKK